MTELLNKVTQGDCLEVMKRIPEASVNLIVIDPPYNIGKDKRWDKWNKVDDYVAFMSEVFKECERVLKPNGSFYWFHNDMTQIRKLMDAIDVDTDFVYKNFIVWNKRYEGSPRKYYFDNVLKTESSRCYRPLTEYCMFYTFQDETGLKKLLPEIMSPIQDYFKTALNKSKLTYSEISSILGISSTAVQHWFDYPTQPRIPTADKYAVLQSLMELKMPYTELKKWYETLKNSSSQQIRRMEENRYVFNNIKTHHDVWNYEVAPKFGHVTPKPVDLIENIILHSSNEGDVILDCFLGSGTTAVAAINTGRQFIGIERESEYVDMANKRIQEVVN